MTTSRRKRVRWGQHFLVDQNVARAIVDWAEVDGRPVLEIGPGRGALTELLERRASHLYLVEVDRALAAGWRERYRDNPRVTVSEGDALAVDLSTIVSGPVRVVANLPYESGTAIVTRLLGSPGIADKLVVMLQKEVCDRMLAGEGSKRYGILSVQTQLRADVEAGRVVRPAAFRPRPRVDSQVLRLTPLLAPRYAVGEEALFAAMLQTAFGARRKMLRNTLGPWLAARVGPDRLEEVFSRADVDPSDRPEAVALEKLARLSALIYAMPEEDAGTA